MTKNGFLTKLRDALADLPAADRTAALDFFTEQLDDRIEEGMSEADAVDSLGSFADIVAALHDNADADPTTADATRGASNRPQPASYVADDLPRALNLRETNCAVELLPATDGKLRIEYERTNQIEVTIEREGDTLNYTAREIMQTERRFLFNIIRVQNTTCRKPVRIYLPPNAGIDRAELRTSNAKLTAHDVSLATLKLHTANASITAEQLTANTLTVKTANGSVRAANCTADTVSLTTSNGGIHAEQLTANTLTLTTSNGSIKAEQLTTPTLTAKTSNASVKVENLTAHTASLTTSNGRIELGNVDESLADVTLTTSNGSIHATLPGSIDDYRITSSGGSLPKQKNSGTKSLAAKTSNGKINIDFIADR